jgi:hypothetical protein
MDKIKIVDARQTNDTFRPSKIREKIHKVKWCGHVECVSWMFVYLVGTACRRLFIADEGA